jgi:hypothetical protein
VRGLLSAALDRRDELNVWAAYEVGAAWRELDEPHRLSTVTTWAGPILPVADLLRLAQALLRGALPRVQPGARAVSLGLAAQHVQHALDAQAAFDGPPDPIAA